MLGAFWNKLYTDSFARTLRDARVELEKQQELDRNIIAATSICETTPVYRIIRWLPLDITSVDRKTNVLDIPDKVCGGDALTNRIKQPDVVLNKATDFTILTPGKLQFLFPAPNFEILWLKNAQVDERYLADFWGRLLGLDCASSEDYKQLLCLIYSAIRNGTTKTHVENVVRLFYRTSEDGWVRFFRPDDKEVLELVDGITLDARFLDPTIKTPLTFPNEELLTTEWPQGDSVSVDKFWELATKKGLIKYLPVGKINPAKFLLENVLRYNSRLCIIKGGTENSWLAGLNRDEIIRILTPPGEALIILRI